MKPWLVEEHNPSPLWVVSAYMGMAEGHTSILVALAEFWLLCRHSWLETTCMNAIPQGLNWHRPGSRTPSSIKLVASFWSSHEAVSRYNVGDTAIFRPRSNLWSPRAWSILKQSYLPVALSHPVNGLMACLEPSCYFPASHIASKQPNTRARSVSLSLL